MNYYDDEKNVEEYIRMSEGFDGQNLINYLVDVLPSGSEVLELGMGPGKDLILLGDHFQVTGSDSSMIFLEKFREDHPDANLLHLDAVTLETTRTFDCIFSNKVLIHLSPDELRQSFRRQAELLNPGGILFHTFWYGDHEEEIEGLRFQYYNRKTLKDALAEGLELTTFQLYEEFEEGDSFFVFLNLKE